MLVLDSGTSLIGTREIGENVAEILPMGIDQGECRMEIDVDRCERRIQERYGYTCMSRLRLR